MAAAFMMAGFEAFDLTMTDIFKWSKETNETDILAAYDGLAFVGGFSYADVLGSAKGWAASIRFNKKIQKLFERFKKRKNTFTLGVCNGCQLSTLIGFVGSVFGNIHNKRHFNVFRRRKFNFFGRK